MQLRICASITMESKLDSFKELKETQDANQKEMSKKLEKLEKDVHAGQDTAAERIVKKLKRDRVSEFKKKGHIFSKNKIGNAMAAMQKLTRLPRPAGRLWMKPIRNWRKVFN